MLKHTKIRRVGNSTGITIPPAFLDRCHLAEGDTVHLVETERGLLITPYDPDFEEAMTVAADVTRRYRNALRELAKR